MCNQCNYPDMLRDAGLRYTPNRLRVLEVIGGNNSPLSAREIHATVSRRHAINRVTVYRILDRLVAKGIVDQISSGGRETFYGLAPNEHHRPHPHFYCRNCGSMECLDPHSLNLDAGPLRQTFAGRIENVEVRVDGICKRCLREAE
jgi:Fur family ferric uptake transcriptional regulator